METSESHSEIVAIGVLSYCDGNRLTVDIDPGLGAYYRSMIPKSVKVQKPRWPTHITVVRGDKETPVNLEHWGRYEGREVKFTYDPDLRIDEHYCWLNVWCDRLSEIREELGLPPKNRWTRPPSGRHHQCFHITIANKKFEALQ